MLHVVAEFMRGRLRQWRTLMPPGYSLAFAIVTDGSAVLIMIGAILQRPQIDVLTGTCVALLVMLPPLLFFVGAFEHRVWLSWMAWWAATAILLTAATPVRADLAPLILVMMMGRVGTLAGPIYSAVAFGSATTLLVVESATHRLDETTLYLFGVVLGWVCGYLMQVQAQLLVKQQETQVRLAEHAAADERRRIAHEVHDVIAHALSATMLHLTGARRTLQVDRDVDDALGALTEAERLGRQAMADIRRTVGLLDASPSGTAPEPGIADIAELIEDFTHAGLPVEWRMDGPGDRVSAAVGLALYRITQESLANVAKHAPDSKATVDLKVSQSTARLTIVNKLAAMVGAAPPVPRGDRGLRGMRQRAEMLGGVIDAGPCERGWSVHAEIPLDDNPGA